MNTHAAAWSSRAQAAADSVNTNFGHRLLGLPGTWIAAVRCPDSLHLFPWFVWHYWWQAHYLDCLVDSARRQSAAPFLTARPGLPPGVLPEPLRRGQALLRTIRIRNFLHLTNSFYDDMAWLALASARADSLSRKISPSGLPSAQRAAATLGAQLLLAQTDDLGGGIFWSKRRDFKNTPATAPTALHFARTGRKERAQRLVDWLRNTLLNPAQGLYMDGIHPNPAGPEIERTVYTYNQGPVIGALLELGGERNLASVTDLIDAIGLHLARDLEFDGGTLAARGHQGLRPLRLEGSGDAGLFTGILVRYLADAALHPALPETARAKAKKLVLDTAEALWLHRTEGPPISFPDSFDTAAGSAAGPIELSSQLQAWMGFEAAFRLVSAP